MKYTVGILNALYNYVDQQKSKDELARKACEIEIDTLKEPIGKQDQYATSYGGLNMIQFLSDGQVKVTPIEIENTIYNISKKIEDNDNLRKALLKPEVKSYLKIPIPLVC